VLRLGFPLPLPLCFFGCLAITYQAGRVVLLGRGAGDLATALHISPRPHAPPTLTLSRELNRPEMISHPA
jgi:hypothetical protein